MYTHINIYIYVHMCIYILFVDVRISYVIYIYTHITAYFCDPNIFHGSLLSLHPRLSSFPQVANSEFPAAWVPVPVGTSRGQGMKAYSHPHPLGGSKRQIPPRVLDSTRYGYWSPELGLLLF